MRSRIRSIKPDVHLDEELWDVEQTSGMPLFRAFTGLWNYSDREGRFEWKPRTLKALILPLWNGSFADAMEALQEAGFLLRYEVRGRQYGLVRNFTKHQSINAREEESVLPPPPSDSGSGEKTTQKPASGHASSRVSDASLHASGTRDDASRGERNGIEEEEREDMSNSFDGSALRDEPEGEPKPARGKPDPVFEHWVKVMARDPSRTMLTDDRRKKLKARRRDGYTDAQLRLAVDGCRLSEFHMGRNDRSEAYNDLVTILKDGKTVDAHIERALKSNPAAPFAPVLPGVRLEGPLP